MNDIRIHFLIESYLSGNLEDADRDSLERALLASPRARELYWTLASTHAELREWGLGQFAIPVVKRSAWRDMTRRLGLGSSAANVAALTLATGAILFTGVALALVPAQRVRMETIRLPVGNAGFEENTAPATQTPGGCTLSELLPTAGAWAADVVRLTGAEQGVTPREGQRMLCFEASLPAPGTSDNTRSIACDLFQFVDLRSYEREIATGEATIDFSAWFCEAAVPREFPVRFTVRLFLYESQPNDVGATWPNSRLDAVAMQQAWMVPSAGDAEWRPLAVKAIVPPTTRCALLHITASNNLHPHADAHLGRQYCDDAQVVLKVPAEAAISPVAPRMPK